MKLAIADDRGEILALADLADTQWKVTSGGFSNLTDIYVRVMRAGFQCQVALADDDGNILKACGMLSESSQQPVRIGQTVVLPRGKTVLEYILRDGENR